jgi:hypothetical protein
LKKYAVCLRRRNFAFIAKVATDNSRAGFSCIPWNHQNEIKPVQHLELVGGHNYCRNPRGAYQVLKS